MTGSYNIEIRYRNLVYKLSIKRNINIICGNSATGKTNMIELIRLQNVQGRDSGVEIRCDKPCVVLEGSLKVVQTMVSINPGSIFFMDEGGTALMKTSEFTEIIKNADGYFVLVTRERLSNLPYSIHAIYYLNHESKYNEYKQKVIVNTLYNKYISRKISNIIIPNVFLTEDSQAGFQFFKKFLEKRECSCIPANGKSNIPIILRSRKDIKEVILVMVDGAAFGPEFEGTLAVINGKKYCNIIVLAYESFEYLLLKSGIVPCHDMRILDYTEDVAESTKYLSWERFFTEYVQQSCSCINRVYTKSKISDWCITEGNIKKMQEELPQNIQFV